MGFEVYGYDPAQPNKQVDTMPVESVSAGIAIDLYRAMLRIRRCEEALIKEYHPADEMRCPVHFCVGQEAVSAALSLTLRAEDYLFSHHRSHGYYLAKGASMNALFAEIYGRTTGADAGKAGSQDISMPSVNFFSGAILTGATAISAGVALSIQQKGDARVVAAGFGEGATDEGVFWETANYASLRGLPLIFVCENNRYATYSPQHKRTRVDNIARRVSTFGIESQTIFGNDVIRDYLTIKEAIERAKSGEGPIFIEAFTYRWNGHVGPEDDDHIGYRPNEELSFWKAHCPIKLVEAKLLSNGWINEARKNNIVEEINCEITAAFEYAKTSPFPQVEDWASCNLSPDTPAADKYLVDSSSTVFNQNQADLTPGPY